MRIGTLFSGIGAPEQGAKRVYGNDLELVFACEWDKFARQSFNANYEIKPEHFHKDVREMDGTQYQGKVDVLIGGSPCQAFSIAGLRNGTDDERGQLIYQYIRIVDEVKAPIIIYENVKGMLSIQGGKTIREFVQALRDIGYYCHYEVVNTKDYGVPQNRERIFLVGFIDHEMYHRFQFAPKQKLEKRLKDVLESEVDEKYYLKKQTISTFEYVNSIGNQIGKIGGENSKHNNSITNRIFGIEGISPTLTTASTGGNQETKILVNSATSCGYELAAQGDSINLSVPNSKTRRGRVGKQVAQTLDTQCNQAVIEPKIIDFTNDFSESKQREYTEYSPCLRSERFGLGVQEPKILQNSRGYNNGGLHDECPTITSNSFECNNFVQTNRIRKLTPRECLRLQDFPDSFLQVVSDSQMYKQAGNSMSVNILEMIFQQIEKSKTKSAELLF